MKKRILAWFLAVVMAIGMLPAAALATGTAGGVSDEPASDETSSVEQQEEQSALEITIDENSRITVDGISYRLVLGDKTVKNNSVSYSGGDFLEFIMNSSDETSFESDILLLDADFQNEASESVYNAFWESCNVTVTQKELTNASVSAIQTREDGYHRYVSCSVTGETSGSLFVNATQDGNTNRMVWNRNVSVCQATELKLDEAGQASFEIAKAQKNAVYAFYVDLGAEKAAEASAKLNNENVYGKVTLENGKFLWKNFEDEDGSKEYSYSVSAQKIFFLVYPFTFTDETTTDITGTISVEVEQPKLMYRLMKNSKGTWTESTNTLQPVESLSPLNIGLNGQSGIRFYYGTSSDYTLVSDAVLTSADPSIASVSKETGSDDESFFLIKGSAYASTALTLSAEEVQCTITASVSPMRGFYSTQERAMESYLTSVAWEKLSLDEESGNRILWFTGITGFGGDQSRLSVTVNGATGAYEWMQRGETNIYDMKILLPDPNGVSYEVSVIRTYNGTTTTYGSISVECPGLMFRYMDFNDVTWVESTRPLQDVSNLTFDKLNDSKRVRFYYGTSASSVPVTSVVSDNPDVVGVTTETAADNGTYYVLTANGFGSATLTAAIGDVTETFTATVDLPSYGFYSANARTVEKYLPEVVLTGEETDLTEIWFIGKNSIGDGIVVKANGIDITSKSASVGDTALKITLPDDITSSVYELSVYRGDGKLRGTMVRQPGGSQSGGDSGQNGYASYIGDYVIGFAEKRADGEVTKICENADKIFGHGTIENTSPDVAYRKEVDIRIAAATKSEDTTGTVIYTVDPDVTNSVVIKRLWVETHSGDNTTYSWSGDSLVTELTSVQEESVPLYVKAGRNCEATICAQIAVTVGEQTYEKTVRMNIGLTIIGFSGLTRPDNDTVEQLNAFLAELAEQINTTDSTNEIYHIELGSTTYEGTIHVPAAFKRGQACLHFVGTARNGRQTVVKGGLDVNGAFIEYIKDIHFVADESSADQTRAIFGGGLRTVGNCSFYGYDIALDSSEGLINANSSVFVNNEIAALVNVNDSMDYNNVLPGDWSSNTFINNGTAVQILSLTKRVSPYYFRIYDSNFINNGTDIDARCGGTLYMYRNYFGQYKEYNGHRPHPGKYHHDHRNGREHLRLDELLNARTEPKLHSILDYARAKIHTENETEVVTNPRWQHPVKDWWSHNSLVNDTFFGPEPASYEIMTLDEEEEYEDVQVADWEDKTIILNEESNGLRLDASAFNSTGDKEIGVVDENEETLGIWNFD